MGRQWENTLAEDGLTFLTLPWRLTLIVLIWSLVVQMVSEMVRLNRFQKMCFNVRSFILWIDQAQRIDQDWFLPISSLMVLLASLVMRITFLKLRNGVFVLMCTILRNPINSSKIINIKEVKDVLEQCIIRIIAIKHRFLLKVPILLGRREANVAQPVNWCFKSQYFDCFVLQFTVDGVFTWYLVLGRWDISEYVRVNVGHPVHLVVCFVF